MCGLADLSRCGSASFEHMNVPRVVVRRVQDDDHATTSPAAHKYVYPELITFVNGQDLAAIRQESKVVGGTLSIVLHTSSRSTSPYPWMMRSRMPAMAFQGVFGWTRRKSSDSRFAASPMTSS